MSHHLAAFTVSISTTANTDMPAVADDVLARVNNHYMLQTDMFLIWAAAMSATFNRARIVSPSNRQIALPYIRPVIRAATPGDDPNFAQYIDNPFRIRAGEELAIEGTSDIAMGNEQATALVALQDTFEPMPRGDIFTLRGTSTTASVANVWTSLVITWEQTPQAGIYAVVGLEYFAATAVAARMIFENQLWRPGTLAVTSVGQKVPPLMRLGNAGVMGRFRPVVMPQIQVFNAGAVSTHEFFLDFIKIG